MKNRDMKKIIILMLTLLLAFSFMACTLSPQVAYDNFVTDLDIMYRMEEIAFNVQFGRYSQTWQREIAAVVTDLETFDIDDDEAARINNMYVKSANAFLKASVLFLQGDVQSKTQAAEWQVYAVSKYREARDAYHTFIID